MAIISVFQITVCFDYKTTAMVYLNYNNLDKQTQEKLLHQSKAEIEKRYGRELEIYALSNQLAYDVILEEEAIRNLYTYKFIFTV